MKLINNWRRAWRMLSVQLSGLLALLAAAEVYLPQLREHLPANWYGYLAIAVIVARVVRQPKLEAANAGADKQG